MPPRTYEKDKPGKLFVGGLAEELDEKGLEREFSKFGLILEAMVIRDKQTNVSRGFGFVTFENPVDAEEASKNMDGKEVRGKKLHVEDAIRGGVLNRDAGYFSRGAGYRDGDFRGRGRGARSSRGRPPMGAGGYDGYGGGQTYSTRGSSYSRGGSRGGGMMSRYDRLSPLPIRRDPTHSRNGFDSSRGRSMSGYDSRREDRYDAVYQDRGQLRSRDMYSPLRESERNNSMATRYSFRDGYGQPRADGRIDGYNSSGRGEYPSRGSLRDSYGDAHASGDDGFYREPVNSRAVGRYESRSYAGVEASARNTRDVERGAQRSAGGYTTRDADFTSKGYSSVGSMYGGGSKGLSTRGAYLSTGSDRRISGGGGGGVADREVFSAGTRRSAGLPSSHGGPPPSKRPRSDGLSSFRR